MKLTRRQWNNVLILAIIAFIAVLNVPSLIRTYLLDPQLAKPSAAPFLLDPNQEVVAIYATRWSLEKNQGRWRLDPPAQTAPEELAQRWLALQGTIVDEATYRSLSAGLSSPVSIEVWYRNIEEPQRITWYQTEQFSLFQNWQQQWIAISVQPAYLLP